MSVHFPTSEGPHADYGVSKVAQERAKLQQDKNCLAKANDPWHAFYYLVAEHLDVRALSGIAQKIGQLSNQLNGLEYYVVQISNIKSDFFSGKTDVTGASTTQFRKDLAAFINKLLGQNIMPTSGGPITYNQFEAALNAVPSSTNKLFSDGTISSIITGFMKGFDVNPNNKGVLGGTETLHQLWQKAESGNPYKGPDGTTLPYPAAIDGWVNAMSAAGGYVKGVSGVETTKLNYLQKHYSGVMAYLKSLFGDYLKELKTPVSKEK